jgi:hypothetical protein
MGTQHLMLYKFKSLNNIEQVFDIIINQRLYCGLINDLNDVREASMEMNASLQTGIYGLYSDMFKGQIQNIRVLSLTKSYKNHLMWAHYADGYKGVAICVRVIKTDFSPVIYKKRCPDYDKLIKKGKLSGLKETILFRKYKCWKKEEEYRHIQKEEYYRVCIKEVILGSRINEKIQEVLGLLCKEYGIAVSKLVVEKGIIKKEIIL